jgi:hypothetical protein
MIVGRPDEAQGTPILVGIGLGFQFEGNGGTFDYVIILLR